MERIEPAEWIVRGAPRCGDVSRDAKDGPAGQKVVQRIHCLRKPGCWQELTPLFVCIGAEYITIGPTAA
jgi:hypothetical protein